MNPDLMSGAPGNCTPKRYGMIVQPINKETCPDYGNDLDHLNGVKVGDLIEIRLNFTASYDGVSCEEFSGCRRGQLIPEHCYAEITESEYKRMKEIQNPNSTKIEEIEATIEDLKKQVQELKK